jgi:hypothetical protein
VQIFQVKGGKFVKETDWFRAYPEVLARLLKASCGITGAAGRLGLLSRK